MFPKGVLDSGNVCLTYSGTPGPWSIARRPAFLTFFTSLLQIISGRSLTSVVSRASLSNDGDGIGSMRFSKILLFTIMTE